MVVARVEEKSYNWLVGLRKAAYVALMMFSVSVTSLVKTGQLNGPEDLCWPVLLSGVAVAADWLRNFLKVAEPDLGKGVNRLPIVLLMAALASLCMGCSMSRTHFEERANVGTPDEIVTIYDGRDWTPVLGKKEKTALQWKYSMKDGAWEIGTGQEATGIDNSGQAEIVNMVGQVVMKFVESYVAGLSLKPVKPLDVVHDALPLIGSKLSVGGS